jgi:hypothetical protein
LAKHRPNLWVNDFCGCPKIEGNLEISKEREGILIDGDPSALRSLAKLLVWLADVDQESLQAQPDGARFHMHLHSGDSDGFNSLTPFSEETVVGRLDAKGTGEFPEKYRALTKRTANTARVAKKRRSAKGAAGSKESGQQTKRTRSTKKK